jgi:hypothetical protein
LTELAAMYFPTLNATHEALYLESLTEKTLYCGELLRLK